MYESFRNPYTIEEPRIKLEASNWHHLRDKVSKKRRLYFSIEQLISDDCVKVLNIENDQEIRTWRTIT
jgi:hypothetical protein